MDKNCLLNFSIKHLIAPIIVGVVVFAITQSCNGRTIRDLKESNVALSESIQSLDNTIKFQRDSLIIADKHIENLEVKLRNYADNKGVIVERDVVGSTVIGSIQRNIHHNKRDTIYNNPLK